MKLRESVIESAAAQLLPGPVTGRARSPWCEEALTRAQELQSLACVFGMLDEPSPPASESANPELWRAVLRESVERHLAAVREAAVSDGSGRWRYGSTAVLGRTLSNLDAAEATLLHLAPARYVLGQMPSLLNHVQRHLSADDPRRQEFERIATAVGLCRAGSAGSSLPACDPGANHLEIMDVERHRIVSIVRGASSAAMREQHQVRSFRNVLVLTSVVMLLLAVGLAVFGLLRPAALPLCFQPVQQNRIAIVCPVREGTVEVQAQAFASPREVEQTLDRTADRLDVVLVEGLGLMAAAVAAASAVRRVRGSSEPHDLPIALALLKLPTGALTAVLGVLLLRGEFIPGLSALDSPGQIVAWAIVLGYGQQLFTYFVDQQAHTVLDSVRGKPRGGPAVQPDPREAVA